MANVWGGEPIITNDFALVKLYRSNINIVQDKNWGCLK